MIRIRLSQAAQELLGRFRSFPKAGTEALRSEMDVQNELTVGHTVKSRMTGEGPFPIVEGRLGVVTGRLRRSVRPSQAVITGTGKVASAIGSNVRYFGVHEFGGYIQPRTIRPVNKGTLRFLVGGKVIFAKQVQQRGRYQRPRRPLQRGLMDRRSAMGDALSEAMVKVLSL